MKSTISDYKATVVVLDILGLCSTIILIQRLAISSHRAPCYITIKEKANVSKKKKDKKKTERQPYGRSYICAVTHIWYGALTMSMGTRASEPI